MNIRNAFGYHCNLASFYVTTIVLGIGAATFSSCTTQRAILLRNKSIKEWSFYQLEEVKKSTEGKGEQWTIYSRKIKGTNFFEYKIEGDIDASPETCLLAFKQDMLNKSKDLKNKKYPTYEIVSGTPDSLLTYIIHHEPFPFKDTEMSLRYVFYNNVDGSTGVAWHEAWNECQVSPSKKLSRVKSFRGAWQFTSTSDNSCLSSNSIEFDPNGMPQWLFKPMVMRMLKNGLASLREMSAKQAKQAIGSQ